MANYQQLKQAIANVIKTNGEQAITGQVLQDVLNSMVSVLGANYMFAGVATPAINPGTPDQNVFYLATEDGIYYNFGGIQITERSLFVFLWNGTWTNIDLLSLDDFYQDIDALVTQFEQQLRQMLEDYQPIVIEGNVTNAPDEEDLTSVDNLLRFKNRNTLYGMGFIYLRRELGFAEQLTQENTIYVIRYDYTLTADVTVPANCVLKFEGGSISGAYTIKGQNTGINAGLVKIFGTDVTLAGTWNVSDTYPEWFGNSDDFSTALNKLGTISRSVIVLSNREYPIKQNVTLGHFVSMRGSGRSIIHIYDSYIKVGNHATLKDFSIYIDTLNDFSNFLTAIFIDADYAHGQGTESGDFARGLHNVHITVDNVCISDRNYNINNRNKDTSGIYIHASSNTIDSGVWDILINNVQVCANVKRAFYVETDTNGWSNGIKFISCTAQDCKYGWWIQGNNTNFISPCVLDNCSMQWDDTKSTAALYARYTYGLKLYNFQAYDAFSNTIDMDETNEDTTIDYIFQVNPFINKTYPKGCTLGRTNLGRNINDFLSVKDGFTKYTVKQLMTLPDGVYRVRPDSGDNKYHTWLALPNCNGGGLLSINSWGVGKQIIYTAHASNPYTRTFCYVPSSPSGYESDGDINNLFWVPLQRTKYSSNSGIENYTPNDDAAMALSWENKRPCWKNNDGFREADGAKHGVLRAGTFANKPSYLDIYAGFRYFCTDRQTAEGATDGIEIIHKGNDVWVDALGRVVS